MMIKFQTAVSNSGESSLWDSPFSPSITTLFGRQTIVPPVLSTAFCFIQRWSGAVGFGHFDLAVFYFAYIGAVYFDHLIFPKGIGAVFLAVYGNSNTSVIPAAGEIHATPEEQGKHHDANNKSQFFFFKFNTSVKKVCS